MTTHERQTLTLVAAVATLSMLATVCSAASSKPNILILFADDLGYGDASCYGHPTTSTPNIDRLASEGIRFTQWYSAFHVCSPSRAAMMTGRLPIRSGCTGDQWTGNVFSNKAVGGLPLNETTIAEALRPAGYRTAAIGKWHLGVRPEFLPYSRGFSHYYGVPYSVDMGSSAWKPGDDIPLPLVQNLTVVEAPTNLNNLTSRYLSFAHDFISNSSAEGSPWLLYFAFNHVHVPDFVSPQFCNTTSRGLFGDALAEMDYAIGQVLDTLASTGEDEDTIVFFTSDNGPWLTKFLRGGSAGLLRDGKTTTWEGGVRVPGIIRWKDKITPGINHQVVATYDIFPTALALAGVPLPKDRFFDGKDLSGLLFDNKPSPHECIFIYKGTPGNQCPEGHPGCPGLWATRCGSYKLHYVTSNSRINDAKNATFHDPPLIFHLDNDPGENFPLTSSSSEYQQARSMIEAAVAAHKNTLTPVPNQIGKGDNIDFAICGCPNSQHKYPSHPNCTCNPDNYNDFVCGSRDGSDSPPFPPCGQCFGFF